MAFRLKVCSLLVQWIRRFASSPSSWVSFFSYWCWYYFDVSALEVLSSPSDFYAKALPPFYSVVLSAWREIEGSYCERRSSLVMASLSPHHFVVASSMSANSCYLFLLSESRSSPHCIEKFRPMYGDLYWPSTWAELFFFALDRPVIDLSWKIAHGVNYTADRLLGFGYDVYSECFCGHYLECPSHLFFSCPLAHSVLSWLQSLMFLFSPAPPSLVCCHVLFGFSMDELRSTQCVFVYILNV